MAKSKRIGAPLPATNPVVEPDFYRVIPKEITVHFERMWNGRWGGQMPKTGIADEDDGHRISLISEEANEVDWHYWIQRNQVEPGRGTRRL